MATSHNAPFLSGVIEGFYGQPWSQAERFELFERMAAWGLNTYFYCPKDDWKNRSIWRELYDPDEQAVLAGMIRECTRRGIHCIYGISPGLDIRYSDASELRRLEARFAQLIELGGVHFALLFDDIPDRMDPADVARFGSLAAAQADVANSMASWARARHAEARFLFCPTPYCGRMDLRAHGGEGYLDVLGSGLAPDIDVLWTGPEIISREITVDHLAGVAHRLRRKPLIWDNLHANDYDMRRFFCGPYSGRPLELKDHVSGILTNPNCELALNFCAFHTLAAYVRARAAWSPRAAFVEAVEAWLPQFAVSGVPVAREDILLLADCYYLPFEDGAGAVELRDAIRRLLARPPSEWGEDGERVRARVVRLRDACARLADLRSRPLFYALWRRVWELREEMDLLDRFLVAQRGAAGGYVPAASDFHLPQTYRGGFVNSLQRLLVARSDGTFLPAANPTSERSL